MSALISKRSSFLFIVLSLVILSSSAFAQSGTGQRTLRRGIELFVSEDYRQAILVFKDIILDPKMKEAQADAYFWISKSYITTGQLDDAERNLEHFLAEYLYHPRYSEALYLKGRLLFLQEDLEGSIQILSKFLDRYPDSDFVPNAYFWIAEALYRLGHLDEAKQIFSKIEREYPKSYKIEEARYRLSLIEFKRRENELLKLLKWSHEESLKTVEEFQRREKAYEQAITAYQRQIAGLKTGDWDTVEELTRKISRLERENAELRSQVEALRQQLSEAAEAAVPPEREAAAPPESIEQSRRDELLDIMREALALKELLLERIESEPEGR